MGNAEIPAAPIMGLIFFLKNRFKSLAKVDLPEPDGPITTTTSPFLISILTPFNTSIAAGGIPPFLAGDDPRGKFMDLFEKRTPRFREIADITIQVPAEPVAEDLCNIIYNELADKSLI